VRTYAQFLRLVQRAVLPWGLNGRLVRVVTADYACPVCAVANVVIGREVGWATHAQAAVADVKKRLGFVWLPQSVVHRVVAAADDCVANTRHGRRDRQLLLEACGLGRRRRR
jgi:hypothetical protein